MELQTHLVRKYRCRIMRIDLERNPSRRWQRDRRLGGYCNHSRASSRLFGCTFPIVLSPCPFATSPRSPRVSPMLPSHSASPHLRHFLPLHHPCSRHVIQASRTLLAQTMTVECESESGCLYATPLKTCVFICVWHMHVSGQSDSLEAIGLAAQRIHGMRGILPHYPFIETTNGAMAKP